MRRCLISLSLFTLFGVSSAFADILQVDFEGLADSTAITTQFAGFVFSRATVLTAGVSLNEFEFPPHSGTNVAFDDGGPMTISFLTPVLNFNAFFTYSGQLTVTAFDAGNNLVGLVYSLFPSNYVSTGNPANELLSLDFAGGIASIIITGDAGGGSFVIDDITVTTPNISAVPEVSSLTLLAAVALLLAMTKLSKRRPTLT